MLSREELAKSGPPDFTLGQKEKDYFQGWVLAYLSRSGFGGAFKGGTALQKAFGLPRYSEDLDFTLGDEKMPDFEAMERYLLSAGFGDVEHKMEEKEASHQVRLKAGGPLFNSNPVSLCAVVMDFSLREKLSYPPKQVTITPSYSDLLPYALPVMDRREISAEKVRAIFSRKSARDLYDLYFLLRNNCAPSLETVNQKLDYYGMEFDFAKFKERVDKLEQIYLKEMKALTSQAQDYSLVSKEVLEEIKKALR